MLRARYDEEKGSWTVTVRAKDGGEETLDARALISGVGQLNRPKLPEVRGLGSFCGPAFHSAQWDHSVDLHGKRVAVLGSGASAFQLVPEIATRAGSGKRFPEHTAVDVPESRLPPRHG